MSCENLVCAMCAGPVVEGHCATCRASRAHVHHGVWLTPQMVALLLVVLTALTVLAAHVN